MLEEVTATNSSFVSRPVLTAAVQSSGMRSSRPPVPFGILRKSPRPSCFCSVVKAQWSVATKGPYVAETFPVHIEDSYVIVET